MPVESILNFVSIVIGAFLGLHFAFLSTRKNKTNLFLGIFLLLTAISVAAAEGEAMGWAEHPMFRLFGLCSPYLFVPILFYYALGITNSLRTKAKQYAWIFIPAGLDILIHLIFFEQDGVREVMGLLSSPFSLYIFFLLMRELRKHNEHILNIFSSIEDKQLRWLRILVSIHIGFSILWLIDDSLGLILGDNPISTFLAGVSLVATLGTILWIGFAGLRQDLIFEEDSELPEVEPISESEPTEIITQRFAAIVEQIESENLYLDRDLSLSGLALKLEMKNKELSHLINQGYGENFYQFINHFRVQYFKQIQEDPAFQNRSIEGLALEAGFKSKSTFYAAFKKVEGMTPKQYESRKK